MVTNQFSEIENNSKTSKRTSQFNLVNTESQGSSENTITLSNNLTFMPVQKRETKQSSKNTVVFVSEIPKSKGTQSPNSKITPISESQTYVIIKSTNLDFITKFLQKVTLPKSKNVSIFYELYPTTFESTLDEKQTKIQSPLEKLKTNSISFFRNKIEENRVIIPQNSTTITRGLQAWNRFFDLKTLAPPSNDSNSNKFNFCNEEEALGFMDYQSTIDDLLGNRLIKQESINQLKYIHKIQPHFLKYLMDQYPRGKISLVELG